MAGYVRRPIHVMPFRPSIGAPVAPPVSPPVLRPSVASGFRVRRLLLACTVAVGLAMAVGSPDAQARRHSAHVATLPVVQASALPPEGRDVLARIRAGGPFASRRDGVVFGNRERLLPARPRGYYAEYTVPTPGAADRGARRIVAGRGTTGDVRTSGEYYYTNDHYQSFRRIAQ